MKSFFNFWLEHKKYFNRGSFLCFKKTRLFGCFSLCMSLKKMLSAAIDVLGERIWNAKFAFNLFLGSITFWWTDIMIKHYLTSGMIYYCLSDIRFRSVPALNLACTGCSAWRIQNVGVLIRLRGWCEFSAMIRDQSIWSYVDLEWKLNFLRSQLKMSPCGRRITPRDVPGSEQAPQYSAMIEYSG